MQVVSGENMSAVVPLVTPASTAQLTASEETSVKLFELALVQAKVTYNKYGWHDPQGRFFVLKEELERHGGLESYIEKVEKEEIQVEPLVIRVNAGEV